MAVSVGPCRSGLHQPGAAAQCGRLRGTVGAHALGNEYGGSGREPGGTAWKTRQPRARTTQAPGAWWERRDDCTARRAKRSAAGDSRIHGPPWQADWMKEVEDNGNAPAGAHIPSWP